MITSLVALMVALSLVAVVLAAWGGWYVIKFQAESQAEHAKCIAHVASVTSNQAVARALREAAEHYDSMDGQAELAVVRTNKTLVLTKTSVPSQWMLDRADKIEAGL